MAATVARIVGPADGKFGKLGGIGVRFMVSGEESGGGFALVEHPMEPHALAGPMHRRSREDDYSFVLAGRVGADAGGKIAYRHTAALIFIPRAQSPALCPAPTGGPLGCRASPASRFAALAASNRRLSIS